MFKKIFTSPKFILILGIITLIIFIYSLSPVKPTLISTTPINNSQDFGINQSIRIEFSSKINSSDFTVTSTPQEKWDVISTESKTIDLRHELSLKPNTKYNIDIFWKSKPYLTLTFKTLQTQTDTTLLQDLKNEQTRNYPLIRFTPYENLNYSVVYLSPMTLQITPKTKVLTDEEMINSVKAWVTNNGGDAASHKYTVVDSSPTP